MRCPACKRRFDGELENCPYCGEAVRTKPVAMLKTSTILIASDEAEGVFRSVREVPEPLRQKLLRSTSGLNARTILIADRLGQQQIARALEALPGASQASTSGNKPSGASRLTLAYAGILLAGVTGVAAWLLLFRR